MAEVVANGVRLHVQRLAPPAPSEGAPVVVFVHGLILDNLSSFYYTLANPVALAGGDVILYDLRGHGLSEVPATGYTTHQAASDLDGLLDCLEVSTPVHLVTNSYGGLVALRLALAHPERVASLLAVEVNCTDDWTELMANTLTVIALALEHDGIATALAALGQRRMARTAALADNLLNGTTLIDDLASERPFTPTELARLTAPVCVFYGEHTELLASARLLEASVPSCHLEIVPGLGHTVLREATDVLRRVALSWLADQAGLTAEAATPTI